MTMLHVAYFTWSGSQVRHQRAWWQRLQRSWSGFQFREDPKKPGADPSRVFLERSRRAQDDNALRRFQNTYTGTPAARSATPLAALPGFDATDPNTTYAPASTNSHTLSG